jgi:hypothetical protein
LDAAGVVCVEFGFGCGEGVAVDGRATWRRPVWWQGGAGFGDACGDVGGDRSWDFAAAVLVEVGGGFAVGGAGSAAAGVLERMQRAPGFAWSWDGAR